MDYRIALDPELGLSSSEFIEAWNESPACTAMASASVEKEAAVNLDPGLMHAALVGLAGVATGVATNAIYDLIKQLLIDQDVKKSIEVVDVEQPDGGRLVIVKIKE